MKLYIDLPTFEKDKFKSKNAVCGQNADTNMELVESMFAINSAKIVIYFDILDLFFSKTIDVVVI